MRRMKELVATCAVAVLCVGAAACSNENENKSAPQAQNPTPAPTPAPTPPPAPAPTPAPAEAAGAPAGFPTAYTPGAAVKNGGSITGTVKWTGPAPKLEPLPVFKDTNVCGTTKPNERLIVDKAGNVQNAVVWIEDISTGGPLEAKDITVDQSKCLYSPHISIVPLGANLVMKNSDPILHNVHSYFGTTPVFNQAQPLKGQTNPFKMAKPGVLGLRCDVHLHMNAYSIVAPTPYFAVTDGSGKFTIKDVPPGTYKVHLWHEGWQTTVSPDKTQITFSDPVEDSHPGVVVASGKAATVDFTLPPGGAAK